MWLLSVMTAAFILVSPVTFASTENVFSQYRDRLVQIRIVDINTNSKSTIGSGFFIDQNGTIATNYHVVSKHVFKPKQYRIEYTTEDGKLHRADLLHIDVLHDLALLSGDAADTPFLKISERKLNKGVRIYTLGNPLDLGMTIVEGTYNGITDDTRNERILLASALNPGMSGGPSIIEDGSVIGVNVATAGNSIGFLVPQYFLSRLQQQAQTQRPTDFMQVIRDQLLTYQNDFITALMQKPFPSKSLGNYTVPGKIADYMTCWGDSNSDKAPYRKSNSFCATKNEVYLEGNLSTGTIRYVQHYLSDLKMGKFRFYHLVENYFGNPNTSLANDKEEFTEFNCKVDYVRQKNQRMKTAFCLREYKKFKGLYDSVLVTATLNQDTISLVSSLTLAGVSYDNAVSFSKFYLRSLAWKHP